MDQFAGTTSNVQRQMECRNSGMYGRLHFADDQLVNRLEISVVKSIERKLRLSDTKLNFGGLLEITEKLSLIISL